MKPVSVARKKNGSSNKTPYNVLKGRHPPKLKSLEDLAKSLKVPLWVLMVPGIPDDLCNDVGLQAIQTLVTDYLTCESREDRQQIERVAHGFAELCKKKKL